MQDNNVINEIIINRFLGNELSEYENDILNKWLEQDDNRELYKNMFDKEWMEKEFGIIDKLNKNKEDDRATIKARVAGKKSKFIDLRRYTWWQYVAAAIFILVAGTIYFIVTKTNEKPGNEITQVSEKQDIAPGKQSATLTLADGSTIVLDSSGIGKLAQQGSTQVLNKNGELVYENATPIAAGAKPKIGRASCRERVFQEV
jgi:transmembrane sensor